MKFVLRGLDNNASSWKLIQESVTAVDQMGFWGLTLPDHYMYQYNEKFSAYSTLDSWVALSYLAAKTSTIKLGTLVTPIPFRPASQLAKILATLDTISTGRTFLGIGAGWSQMEFEAYSEWSDGRTRVDKTEEGIQLIRRLWQEPKVDFEGKFYRAKGAVLEPKPLQKPHPPLLFGGYSLRMIRMAGRHGDICYVPPWSKIPLEKAAFIVKQEAREAGRPAPALAAGSPSFQNQEFGMSLVQQDMETAADAGCEYYITPWFPKEDYLATVKRFASELMRSYSDK